MIELCHVIEPVPQPQPHRNEGGDCFACALTAALRWMYPELDVDLDEVWDCFVVEYYDGKAQSNLGKLRDAVAPVVVPPFDPASILEGMQNLERVYAEVAAEKPATTVCNTWGEHGMEKAVRRAAEKFGGSWSAIEVEYELLQPSFEPRRWACNWWTYEPVEPFAQSLERWLGAGYVVMATECYDGTGPYNEDLLYKGSDHFVLIDGVRYGWEDRDGGGRSISYYAHVVCSAAGGRTYWIDVRDLLRKHGVAGLMLVRRSRT